MPPELRTQVEEAAKESGRSLNAEIVHRLEESFDSSSVQGLRDAIARLEHLREVEEARSASYHVREAALSLDIVEILGPMNDQQHLPERWQRVYELAEANLSEFLEKADEHSALLEKLQTRLEDAKARRDAQQDDQSKQPNE